MRATQLGNEYAATDAAFDRGYLAGLLFAIRVLVTCIGVSVATSLVMGAVFAYRYAFVCHLTILTVRP